MQNMREYISARYPGFRWEPVSLRSARSVYRLMRQDRIEYYVKICSPKNPIYKLLNLIRPKTRHEAAMLESLRATGIRVPEVQEHLTHLSGSALITRAVVPSRTLYEQPRETQVRIMLDMCTELINRGYHFTDMHAGNIILDGSDRPVLLDAYEITPLKGMSMDKAASLMAQAVNIYDISVEELEPYLARISGVRDIAALNGKIHALACAQGNARVRRWIARSFRDGSFTEVRRGPSRLAFVHRGYSPDLDALISAHRSNVAQGRDLYKIQDKTQLSRVGEFCIKSYKKPFPLTEPYAKRSWKGLLTLLFNGIPVADPVALVLFRDSTSMLITKALDEPDLDELLARGYAGMAPSQRHALASALGGFIGTLHRKGIYHADLKACNIKATLDPVRFTLLDTDRVRQTLALDRDRRLKNLQQLNTTIPLEVSRAVRMAFLKSYGGQMREDPKILFRDIWELSASSDIVYRTGMGDRIEKWPVT